MARALKPLFGALLLGVIATRSGVARRLAYFIMLRVGITSRKVPELLCEAALKKLHKHLYSD